MTDILDLSMVTEGTGLTHFAGEPEGRLLLAVLENAFAELGALLRRQDVVRELQERSTWWMPSYDQEFQIIETKILSAEGWIFSEARFPNKYAGNFFSVRYIAEAVSDDPEGFLKSVRQSWMDAREMGVYQALRKRCLHGC